MRYTPWREITDGDVAFSGVDMTRDRSLLQPGTMALAQNGRCRTGQYVQRGGTRRPADFDTGEPARFIGSGVFRDPNGNEVLLIAPAAARYTWAVQYGKDPFKINYSVSEDAGRNNGLGGVNFVQSFDKVQLLRFPLQSGQLNLVWDGTGDVNGDGIADTEWTPITLSATGNTLAPSSWNAEPVQDRVVYYSQNFGAVGGRDTWFASDVNDYTSYDSVYGVGRTNSGESDAITRIFAYYQGSFVVFKTQSVHQVTLLPTYPLLFQQRILSIRLGSYGNRMPLEVGGDIIFLSNPSGFYRLSEVVQEQIIALPVAISEPIQPIIDQIQWGATGIFGCSASLDNYALFGVALGANATRPNAILVYNTQSSKWESVADTWADPTFGFNALHVTNYNGVRRVFAIDYVESVIYLLYEGLGDDLKSAFWNVPFKMETRGYVGDDPFAFKRFLRVTCGISSFNPSLKVTAISDGAFEETDLTPTPITKDRLKFYTQGKPAFDPVTGDATAPYREDYSVGDDVDAAIEDFESLPDGELLLIPPTDFGTTGQKQESSERLLYRGTGRWLSLRFQNSSGECDILNTSVEATVPVMNNIRSAA